MRRVTSDQRRSAIVVGAWPGQPTCSELARRAAAGEAPRKDYVELARLLDADVIDAHFVERTKSLPVRVIADTAGLEQAQVAAVFSRRREYRSIVAWGDRMGTSLALLFKLTRSPSDLVMVSVWLSTPRKRTLLRYGKIHTELRAIIGWNSVQTALAEESGVPAEKLALLRQRVDERFWQPLPVEPDSMICAVGAEARDYPTLIRAMEGLPVRLELALGSMVSTPTERHPGRLPPTMSGLPPGPLPPNVRVHRHLAPSELRQLYARSRFVVVPLKDVEFDAGATALMEAMAMGKAVVVTRTRGQVDLVRDWEQGRYVPPGDPQALRTLLLQMLDDRVGTERLGRAGRALVERDHRLDDWLAAFAGVIRGDLPPSGTEPLVYP